MQTCKSQPIQKIFSVLLFGPLIFLLICLGLIDQAFGAFSNGEAEEARLALERLGRVYLSTNDVLKLANEIDPSTKLPYAGTLSLLILASHAQKYLQSEDYGKLLGESASFVAKGALGKAYPFAAPFMMLGEFYYGLFKSIAGIPQQFANEFLKFQINQYLALRAMNDATSVRQMAYDSLLGLADKQAEGYFFSDRMGGITSTQVNLALRLRKNGLTPEVIFELGERLWNVQQMLPALPNDRSVKDLLDRIKAATAAKTTEVQSTVCNARPIPKVQRLEGHTGTMMSVAISHDGTLVASGGFDKSVRLWNASSGAEVARLNVDGDTVSSIAFSPDDGLLATSTYRISPPFTDSSLEIWDLRSRRRVSRLIGHTKWVMSITFSPDGRLLASGSNDETVRLWDFRSGKEIQRLRGHGKGVTTIAFSPDGKLLASASNDQTIRLWDSNGWKEVKRFDVVYPVIAFSPDGKVVTSKKNGEINFLEVSAGREIRQISLGAEYLLSGIAFSSDGRLLAVSDGDGLRLLEVSSGREMWRLVDQRIHRQQLLAFSADGKVMAWGGRDARVRLWNTATSSLRQIKITASPPTRYEDFGACPFEGCTYRDWTANKDTIIRVNRSDDSPVAFRVRKGEKITGITGTVLTLRAGCAEVLSPLNVEGQELAPGSIVHPLRYEGEGFWKIWVQGKTGAVAIGQNVEMIEYPETVWWVKIRNARGEIGWSNQPENFDNKDRFGG